MKKVVIIYNSKTGTTMKYAEEMSAYLKSKDFDAREYSIMQYQDGVLENADVVLLGCWTHGLMVIFQHPEKKWVKFAKKLPEMPEARLGLFTTYKILTGSMFRSMYRHLKGKFNLPGLILKSRNRHLSQEDKDALDAFLAAS